MIENENKNNRTNTDKVFKDNADNSKNLLGATYYNPFKTLLCR